VTIAFAGLIVAIVVVLATAVVRFDNAEVARRADVDPPRLTERWAEWTQRNLATAVPTLRVGYAFVNGGAVTTGYDDRQPHARQREAQWRHVPPPIGRHRRPEPSAAREWQSTFPLTHPTWYTGATMHLRITPPTDRRANPRRGLARKSGAWPRSHRASRW